MQWERSSRRINEPPRDAAEHALGVLHTYVNDARPPALMTEDDCRGLLAALHSPHGPLVAVAALGLFPRGAPIRRVVRLR